MDFLVFSVLSTAPTPNLFLKAFPHEPQLLFGSEQAIRQDFLHLYPNYFFIVIPAVLQEMARDLYLKKCSFVFCFFLSFDWNLFPTFHFLAVGHGRYPNQMSVPHLFKWDKE